MLLIILGLIVSYLIGSIPTAFIFGKLLKKIDIRKYGSGNVGATNALRVLGKRAGITVLILDILKGVISILLALVILPQTNVFSDIFRIVMGVCCICGHNWTIFLDFKGGKGIATTLGVLIGLALKTTGLGVILIFLILIWLLFIVLFRVVSLASIISAVFLPVLTIFFKQSVPIIIASLLLSFFIILRHKSNIYRMLQGKEPRVNLSSKPVSLMKQKP